LHSSSSVASNNNSNKNKKRFSFKLPFLDRESSEGIVSAAAFALLDVAFRRGFEKYNVAFPSSLGGCGAVFALLLAMPRKISDELYRFLRPGADLLAKWLPVFFVPSLVTLPLGQGGLQSASELVKAGIVVVGGLFLTLLATSASVLVARRLFGGSGDGGSGVAVVENNNSAIATVDQVDDPIVAMSIRAVDYAEKNVVTQKGFSRTLFRRLLALTALSGAGAVAAATAAAATRKGTAALSCLVPFSKELSSLFLLLTTLTSFVFGARLPKRFTKVVHPLVTCTGLTWIAVAGLAAAIGKRATFRSVLESYRTGRLGPLSATGAGDVLLFLLGPAVVSLAASMYSRRELVRDNVVQVGTAVGVSTAGGLFGTALAVRLLKIGSPYLRLSLLSRNITSPLAMAIASILGADVSLAVSIVVVTGLIGANFGASILDAFGVRDPVARGLGIGAAAHGLGTAAFANEKDAFPFAAIAMALTASAATVAVSIPILRRAVLQLALG